MAILTQLSAPLELAKVSLTVSPLLALVTHHLLLIAAFDPKFEETVREKTKEETMADKKMKELERLKDLEKQKDAERQAKAKEIEKDAKDKGKEKDKDKKDKDKKDKDKKDKKKPSSKHDLVLAPLCRHNLIFFPPLTFAVLRFDRDE